MDRIAGLVTVLIISGTSAIISFLGLRFVVEESCCIATP